MCYMALTRTAGPSNLLYLPCLPTHLRSSVALTVCNFRIVVRSTTYCANAVGRDGRVAHDG